MTAHIVGGGFGGLAAAALLIRNAGLSGADITIYEADEQLGGGSFSAAARGMATTSRAPSLTRNSAARSTCSSRFPRHAIPLFPSRRISSPSIRASRTKTRRTSSIATAASCTVSGSASPWATG
jgi:phytoene dehydrogenase-like protein